MYRFTAVVLLWAAAARAEKETLPEVPPETGFQKCKDALNLPVLEVLPGGGWDNLRNIDMGRVLKLKYANCKTTEDGQYIIPDEVFTIPQKQTHLDMNSEILESWMNYKSTTSFSINMDLNLYSKVSGKFSTEFQRMKTLQVKDKAVTSRVQVRNLVYIVKSSPASELSLGFKKELIEICSHLESNDTRMATYLAELLVLNYGTHVITSVEAGAALVQEDYIRSSFLKDSQSSRATVTASAGFTFSKVVNFQVDQEFKSQNSLTKSYLANRTNSRVQSIGGIPFYPGITFQVWQEGIANHLVAVDRIGLPLHFFIKPDNLPGVPGPLVEKLSKTVESAVKQYYNFNTYPGCTNVDSPNFNFQANTDDGSCDGKTNNFTFGGVYQECTQLSQGDVNLCQNLEQKNPLTGNFSCPSGYSPVHLHSQIHEEGFNRVECKKKCTLKIFCKTVCEDVFRVAKAEFRAFWCVSKGSASENSALLFGGVFNSKTVNPVTNAQSCPDGYVALSLFESLKVCASLDYELGPKFSVPFGGFFSCSVGNPWVNSATSGDLREPALQKCPGGFSQQLAVISDGCQVSYCVKSGVFTRGALHPVRLPPYTQPPLMSQAAGNADMLTNSEGALSWLKDPETRQWKLVDPMEVSRSGGWQGSTVGGILGAIMAVGVVIALTFYATRKHKKGSQQRQNFSVHPAREGNNYVREQDPCPA